MVYFCLHCYQSFKEGTRRLRIKSTSSKFLGFVHESCYAKYTGKSIPEKKLDVKYLIHIDPKIFELGYKKHDFKKGLFVKPCITGKAYLDFRNKGELSREEQVEQGPMHYYFDNPITWKSRRIRNMQRKILEKNNIKFRLLFYKQYTEEIEELASNEGDRYCKFCNKDFRDEGLFCSQECTRMYDGQSDTHCEVCQSPIEQNDEILHHIEYFPEEKIVSVHKDCHLEIHHSWNHPHLRPPQDAIDDYYGKKKKSKSD